VFDALCGCALEGFRDDRGVDSCSQTVSSSGLIEFQRGKVITLVEEMFCSNEETSSEDDDGGRPVSRLNILGSRKIDQLPS